MCLKTNSGERIVLRYVLVGDTCDLRKGLDKSARKSEDGGVRRVREERGDRHGHESKDAKRVLAISISAARTPVRSFPTGSANIVPEDIISNQKVNTTQPRRRYALAQ